MSGQHLKICHVNDLKDAVGKPTVAAIATPLLLAKQDELALVIVGERDGLQDLFKMAFKTCLKGRDSYAKGLTTNPEP